MSPPRRAAEDLGARSVALTAAALFGLLATWTPGWGQDTLPDPEPRELEAMESARYGSFTFLKRAVGDTGSVTTLLIGSAAESTLESGVRIFFRCMASKPEIYIAATDSALAEGGGTARGQYRFDDGRWSQLTHWPVNESGQALFLPARTLGRFVQQAVEGERIYVQVVGSRGSFRQFVFSLNGLSDGMPRLACFRGALPRT